MDKDLKPRRARGKFGHAVCAAAQETWGPTVGMAAMQCLQDLRLVPYEKHAGHSQRLGLACVRSSIACLGSHE